MHLAENSADFAIMGQPADGTTMLAQPFSKTRWWSLPHPAIPWPKRALSSLGKWRRKYFLLREHGSGTRRVAERYFTSHCIKLPANMEMDTNETIKQSVQAGMGLAIISLHSI